MKHFSIILILIAAACGSSKSISSDPTNPAVLSANTIHIRINEEKTVQLPGIAISTPEMLFTLSDTTVAKVTRKQMLSTYDSTGLRSGDPVLAVWVIKGLKRGTSRMKFAKGRPEQISDAEVRLKNFRIVVTE